MLLGLAAPTMAAEKPGSPMQACTQIWLERRDAGKVEPYKPFLRQCLSQPAAAPKTKAAKPRKTAGAKAGRMTNKVPNRMKVCGARWLQMKADGTTRGQTWRQFSTDCLKR